MTDLRIRQHPILKVEEKRTIQFKWNGTPLSANAGETIAAALYANGIKIFGYHHKDHSPQGIFCANGQCSQCMVIVNSIPVKSCMVPIQEGMDIYPSNGLPELPEVKEIPERMEIPLIQVSVLIIGGGPAGLSAAIELGNTGESVLLIDDKQKLGGKLVLQTHRFFGSSQAVYAGTRGIDIAAKLENEISKYENIEVWKQSTALAVFSDQVVGILKSGNEYVLVKPKNLLIATGAREKFLAFKGNTLPGVFGAGAFQTLVNRDLIKAADKLFIIGGGNVGLITAYHALQAGIEVVGLIEVMPECGGYKVHRDKLLRMGVQIMNSHTILSANGKEKVELVTIAEVDTNLNPIQGTEKSFDCDSILIAVGLDPINEFYYKGQEYGIKTFVAGDAEEIAEASAAIFSGKIRGREITRALGKSVSDIPESWYRTSEILKSHPGKAIAEYPVEYQEGVMPVFHCTQEIPCNPCSTLCPHGLIYVNENDIREIPSFLGDGFCCEACEQCVAGCPGLAITLVDYRNNPESPIVSIPYEFSREPLENNDIVTAMDTEGKSLGKYEVVSVHQIPTSDRTYIVQISVPRKLAIKIAGIQIQELQISQPLDKYVNHIEDDMVVCRCERVYAGEIRALIRKGYRDFNEIKTVTRAGMGACGGKTCTDIIKRLYKEEGIPVEEVTDQTKRPLFMEVPLEFFSGLTPERENNANKK